MHHMQIRMGRKDIKDYMRYFVSLSKFESRTSIMSDQSSVLCMEQYPRESLKGSSSISVLKLS